MLILFLYILGVFFLIHGVYQIYKYFIMVLQIKNDLKFGKKTKRKHRFFIFIPVLHEEKNIEDLLTNFFPQKYPKELYKIYIITTQKEYLDNRRPNTIDILKKIKLKNKNWGDNLIHLHYPKTSGFKAEQLRFAFNSVRGGSKTDISNAFFLLLDADSLMDRYVIFRFNEQIEDDFDFYQQPLLWFKNICEISPLMKSFSFLQSFFSISYEVPMFVDKFFPLRLKYLIGNGLLVKGSFLLKIKNFPSIIEDVRLGRTASFLGSKIKIVPNFTITETAKNLSIQIKQSSVWFFGCGLFVDDYFHSLKINGKRNVKDFILILYGFFKAFRWLNKGIFLGIGLILSIIFLNINLIVLYCIVLICNSIIPVVVVLFTFLNKWKTKITSKKKIITIVFQSLVFSPLMYVLSSIGAYLGLFRLIKYCLCKKVTLPKTER